MHNHSAHILLVEDEPLVRMSTSDLLESFGYSVTAVANGEEALATLENSWPDLILSDVRMPVVDGLKLLREVRSDPLLQDVPFIFVSARTESADLRKGMSLGADDYVMKPFQPEELEKAIAVRLLRSRRTLETIGTHQRFVSDTLPQALAAPLTGLIGVGDLLGEVVAEDRLVSPGELKDYGDIVTRSSERLFRIAKNFMLWSRLETIRESNKRSFESVAVWQKISAVEVLRVAKAVAERFERSDDLEVECDVEAMVKAATHDFYFLAAHLIENAFQFSPRGNRVRVVAGLSNEALSLSVTGTGRGMTAEEIARVGMHRRFDWKEVNDQQGTGMGLMLAMMFTRLSGGRLRFESGPQGLGLTVTMSLPLAKLRKGVRIEDEDHVVLTNG